MSDTRKRAREWLNTSEASKTNKLYAIRLVRDLADESEAQAGRIGELEKLLREALSHVEENGHEYPSCKITNCTGYHVDLAIRRALGG